MLCLRCNGQGIKRTVRINNGSCPGTTCSPSDPVTRRGESTGYHVFGRSGLNADEQDEKVLRVCVYVPCRQSIRWTADAMFAEQKKKTPAFFCTKPRYGGAVGLVGFDGHLNTGLTLRTVRVKDGTAEVMRTELIRSSERPFQTNRHFFFAFFLQTKPRAEI